MSTTLDRLAPTGAESGGPVTLAEVSLLLHELAAVGEAQNPLGRLSSAGVGWQEADGGVGVGALGFTLADGFVRTPRGGRNHARGQQLIAG